MKKIYFLFFILLFNIAANAQKEIKIDIRNIAIDTIKYSLNLGKRLVPTGIAVKGVDNLYHLSTNNINPGIYTLSYTREKNGIDVKRTQLLIDENNDSYLVNIDGFLTNKASFIGSEDNSLFYKYITKHDSIIEVYKKTKDAWVINEDEASFNELAKQEQSLTNLNSLFKQKFTSNVLKRYMNSATISFPAYIGSLAEKKKQRQDFYDNDYLKQINFRESSIINVEQTVDLMDIFTIYSSDGDYKKVVSRNSQILNLLKESDTQIYGYYLNYLLNTFPKITKNSYDLATISLYDDFLANGKATGFISNEKVEKIKESVEKIKKMAPGQTLSNVTLYKQDNSPINIHDIKAAYTMIVIWSPDCSHCKKELPALKKVHDKYKSKEVQIVTLCSKRGSEGVSTCYEYLKSNSMHNWMNLNDEQNLSRYVSIYDATSYPMMILVDKDKKIIMKRKGEVSEAEFEKLFKGF